MIERLFLDSALALAHKGFRIFPVRQGEKDPPLWREWQERATRDDRDITHTWLHSAHNIGILCDGLLVLDLDAKNGAHGADTVLDWRLEGRELPETYTQHTPSGGQHLVFSLPAGVDFPNSVKRLGPGIDTRGYHGYILGAGSSLGRHGIYTADLEAPIARAPHWLIAEMESISAPKPPRVARAIVDTDQDEAEQKAIRYLHSLPPTPDGERDNTGYKIAAKLRDFGCTYETSVRALSLFWVAEPPMEDWEIDKIVRNVGLYAQDTPGNRTAAAVFSPREKIEAPAPEQLGPEAGEPDAEDDPIGRMNKQFAWIDSIGKVQWETTDSHGRPCLRYLSTEVFQKKLAGEKLHYDGSKPIPLSTMWLSDLRRRSYEDVCFAPERECPPQFYNLWRGFAYTPLPVGQAPEPVWQESLDDFLEHIELNACLGNAAQAHWLRCYFAHLIQRPWEKPQTAVVFRGGRGTGKTTISDRIGALLGCHYMPAANRRYLSGNFNAHFENKLLFTLEEAQWGGNSDRGILQDLITGYTIWIEKKGQEAYSAENLLRVIIVGNERWQVPAGPDERRYFVCNVGDGRARQNKWFEKMRLGFEAGGYRLLLRYLQQYKIDVDINRPPDTAGLLEQKTLSLEAIHQWWHECLESEKILGSNAPAWPAELDKETFRQAFHRYAEQRKLVRGWFPDARTIGQLVKAACPSLDGEQKTKGVRVYRFPALATCRKEFETFMNQPMEWR